MQLSFKIYILSRNNNLYIAYIILGSINIATDIVQGKSLGGENVY